MIGLINAYIFDKDSDFQQEYSRDFIKATEKGFPGQEVKEYRVALNEFPKSPNECEVWIVSGSAKSSYDSDPWIEELKEFIRGVHKNKSKMIGFCFGHQIIADALGGKVSKAKVGWGIGIRTFDVMEKKPWMTPSLNQISLLYSHQDQVTELPPGANHLATSEFCPYEVFSIENHILCLQGHPEFTINFAKSRYLERKDKIGHEKVQMALNTLDRPISFEEIWTWIKNFSLNG